MTHLAKNFWFHRNQQHLKQEYMANKMGISQSTYSKLENGTLTITDEHITAFTKTLNLPEDLIKTEHNSTGVQNFNNDPKEKAQFSMQLYPPSAIDKTLELLEKLSNQMQYVLEKQCEQNQQLITIIKDLKK